ncbi:hypothetical protein HMPREF1057_00207 [Bacteroides finegoldii CL09T03C10]|uniref:Uncharacterized protein n=1 Tax=Bacteroides finegoldii CL09T03C10 TaxID=997888 RepID=K5CH26_9BACE|nr:hypothetical protein HMPREF1057_00207 [Bacteroides finegoldii CL09T03C10]
MKKIENNFAVSGFVGNNEGDPKVIRLFEVTSLFLYK